MRVSIKLQNSLSLADNCVLGQLAETRGLDALWVSEFAERDAVTFMTVLGRATEQIDLGASIIPFYTRSDVVLGMTAASLSEALSGRAKLGFGTSTDVIVERWHGRDRQQPMATARDAFTHIRQVLAGEKLPPMDGSDSSGFRYLAPQHVGKIQLLLAALGPKMCELAGEIADGVLLNIVSPPHVEHVRGLVEAGARTAGRDDVADLISDVRVAVSDDPEELSTAREDLRKLVASYGRVGPYNRHYVTSGFVEQAERIRGAFERGSLEEAIDAVDDEMLDALVAVGTTAEVVERLALYADHGLDEIILFPTATNDDETGAVQRTIDTAVRLKERLA